jgi:hypothetical protein
MIHEKTVAQDLPRAVDSYSYLYGTQMFIIVTTKLLIRLYLDPV